MPVSAAEKNPERTSIATRIESSIPSGASFNACFDLVASNDRYLEEKALSEQALRAAMPEC